ncbi:MAG TPA: PqqD family protein [Kofleriaceae bacterium]
MKLRAAKNLVRGELPDGEVVVSVAGGNTALILNSVADAVLELCDGSRTIDEIAQFVRDTVPVPTDSDVSRDITQLVDQLARAGVIESVA